MAETRAEDRDRVEYVGDMLGELRQMTDSECHPMLYYLLEMAYLEAKGIVDNDNGSGRSRNERDAVA